MVDAHVVAFGFFSAFTRAAASFRPAASSVFTSALRAETNSEGGEA